MIDDLDWRALLQRWSAEAIAHPEELGVELSPEQIASGWLGRPPATEEQIAASEAALGRRLPASLREFYSITNGWPVTSFDFGAIVPVEDLGWFREKDPTSFGIWAESMDEFNDEMGDTSYRAILTRSVLMSDGFDQMLLDVGLDASQEEWISHGLTSWYPGLDREAPSFRLGLQGHYATFVQFYVPESVTHDAVADTVEKVYRRLLSGDISATDELDQAQDFGNRRATALLAQINTLRGQPRAWCDLRHAADLSGDDAAFEQDLWPMLVARSLMPRPRGPLHHTLDHTLTLVPASSATCLHGLAERYRIDGGLRADYGGAFGAAIDELRPMVWSGELDAAWEAFLAALPAWSPASPNHVAPMALVWDADLAQLYRPDRGLQLLQISRH